MILIVGPIDAQLPRELVLSRLERALEGDVVVERQPPGLRRDLLEHRRQRQAVPLGDAGHDAAERNGQRAPLLVRVDAEPADAGDAVGEVGLADRRQLGFATVGQDRPDQGVGLGGPERRERGRVQVPVDAHARRGSDLDVQVGASHLHQVGQQLLELSHGSRPRWSDVTNHRAIGASP